MTPTLSSQSPLAEVKATLIREMIMMKKTGGYYGLVITDIQNWQPENPPLRDPLQATYHHLIGALLRSWQSMSAEVVPVNTMRSFVRLYGAVFEMVIGMRQITGLAEASPGRRIQPPAFSDEATGVTGNDPATT